MYLVSLLVEYKVGPGLWTVLDIRYPELSMGPASGPAVAFRGIGAAEDEHDPYFGSQAPVC